MKHNYKNAILLAIGTLLTTLLIYCISYFPKLPKPSVRPALAATKPEDNQLGNIEKSLAQREYHISYDEVKKVHQSPNRKHNLRAYYEPGTLTIRNRKDSLGHNFEFKLVSQGIYADGEKLNRDLTKSTFEKKNNIAEIRFSDFTEQYVNSEEGIRQNFIIREAPAETEQFQVQLSVRGAVVKDLGNNELSFIPKKAEANALTYKDLKCWDAKGNVLAARLSSNENNITINVDVVNASYPVTIDPIIANGNPGNAIKIPEVNQTQAWLGGSVSSAGDVNGDGYSDVIVAASRYDNGQVDEGAAFIYYGSASGVNPAGSVMLQGEQAGARFGCFVSTAGDVNKDGFSDILVGAHMYDKGQTNEGAVFVYHGSAAGINPTASLILESNQAEANFGNAMGLAGDVNADGYSDIMIGARLFDKGQVDEGAVFIYHGSALGINANAPAVTLESNQISAYLGHAINTAGDVNGDGYSDVVVTANMYDKGQTNEGVAFVHYGSSQGINPVAATALEMNQAEAQFGSSAASAGDVNGDGYADVIIGASYYDNGHSNEGAAFVFHGAKTSVAGNPSSTLESNKAGSQFGCSVASVGDVNGDGYSDVIVGAIAFDNGHDAGDLNGDGFADMVVGAELYNGGQANEGAAFVFYGSSNGVSNVATRLESDFQQAWMGVAVSSAGDVNNDGFDDIVIGAPTFSNVESKEGAVILYLGSSAGISKNSKKVFEGNKVNSFFGFSLSSGDVNGDGYSDVLCGAPKYSNAQVDEGAFFISYGSSGGLQSNFIKYEVNQPSANLGHSISCVGDVNGDGLNDIAVGAPYFSNGQNYEGAVFIYNGSTQGLNAQGTLLEQNQPQSEFGLTVAGAGDVNGDGYADIIVGNPSYFSGQAWTGAAHVYFGSKGGLGASLKLLANNGVQNSAFGTSVSGAGDVNADGYSDIIAGDPYFGSGTAFVCYGNTGYNFKNNLRLYNANLTTPINQSQFPQNNFGAGLYSKSFLGSGRGKLVWETKPAGQGFSKGANDIITNSTQSSGSQNVYTNLGLAGAELKSVIAKQGLSTKVRVRVKYDPALALTGQTYGPWRYLPSYLSGGGVSPVPEEAQGSMAETMKRKVEPSQGLVIYPNPASDKIRIDSKNGESFVRFRLLSSNGKLALQGGFQQEIDVRDLPAGKYILLTTHSDGSQASHSVVISK
jgi:menaquinone-dependent protoporphyrinogen IX oxidase